ncbi:aldo/keto reductase [Utexia brackfieldae]
MESKKNVIAIPGSSNQDHIRENLDIFDFELTDQVMVKIDALDRNEKHD